MHVEDRAASLAAANAGSMMAAMIGMRTRDTPEMAMPAMARPSPLICGLLRLICRRARMPQMRPGRAVIPKKLMTSDAMARPLVRGGTKPTSGPRTIVAEFGAS